MKGGKRRRMGGKEKGRSWPTSRTGERLSGNRSKQKAEGSGWWFWDVSQKANGRILQG